MSITRNPAPAIEGPSRAPLSTAALAQRVEWRPVGRHAAEERALLAELLKAWNAAVGEKPVRLRALLWIARQTNGARLRRAIQAILAEQATEPWWQLRLGHFVRNHARDRVVDGLRVEKVRRGKSDHTIWRCVRVYDPAELA